MKPRLALALAAGSALVLVALAARGRSPVVYEGIDGGVDVPTAVAPVPTGGPDSGSVGSVAAGSVTAVLVLAVAVGVVAMLSLILGFGHLRRRRRGVGAVVEPPGTEPGRGDVPEALVRRATEALEELRAHPNGPPGDAVIAAWLTLERAAEDSGAPRQGHQTPTEFTGELLRRHHVDEGATDTLRRVYQRARFGTAEVTAADAHTAAEALAHIVRDLG